MTNFDDAEMLGAPLGQSDAAAKRAGTTIAKMMQIIHASETIAGTGLSHHAKLRMWKPSIGHCRVNYLMRCARGTQVEKALVAVEDAVFTALAHVMGLAGKGDLTEDDKMLLQSSALGVGVRTGRMAKNAAYVASYSAAVGQVKDSALTPLPPLDVNSAEVKQLLEDMDKKVLPGDVSQGHLTDLVLANKLAPFLDLKNGERIVAKRRALTKGGGIQRAFAAPGGKLSDEQVTAIIRIAMDLPVCVDKINGDAPGVDRRCPSCNHPWDEKGDHALRCTGKGSTNHGRHDAMRDELHQLCRLANFTTKKEPMPFPESKLRLDLALANSKTDCQVQLLDVAVTDPLQNKYLIKAASVDCHAANQYAHDVKWRKYGKEVKEIGAHFAPVIFEVYGAVGKEGERVINSIIAGVAEEGERARTAFYVRSRLSYVLWLNNAKAALNGNIDGRNLV